MGYSRCLLPAVGMSSMPVASEQRRRDLEEGIPIRRCLHTERLFHLRTAEVLRPLGLIHHLDLLAKRRLTHAALRIIHHGAFCSVAGRPDFSHVSRTGSRPVSDSFVTNGRAVAQRS